MVKLCNRRHTLAATTQIIDHECFIIGSQSSRLSEELIKLEVGFDYENPPTICMHNYVHYSMCSIRMSTLWYAAYTSVSIPARL